MTAQVASKMHSLCSRNKSVKMAIILVQDFSGAGLSCRLEPNNNALQRIEMTQIHLPSMQVLF